MRIIRSAPAVVLVMLAFGCSGSSTSSSATTTPQANSPATASVPQSSAANPAASSHRQERQVELGTGTATDLIAQYRTECKSQTTPTIRCVALRNNVVVETTSTLQELEAIGDQRSVDVALKALDITGAPEVTIAASQILGHFPKTPNLGERMLPLVLESPYVAVQRMAARVLEVNPNPDFENLGRMWTENHHSYRVRTRADEYVDFPTHYASMGFPKYNNVEWFSPADSDRSIGWSTKDPLATVVKWYRDTTHAEPMGYEKWNDVNLQQATAALTTGPYAAATAKLQSLMEKAMKGDQAALAEIDKLKEQMDALDKKNSEAAEKSLQNAGNVPAQFARDAQWFVVEKKGDRISRMVVVFAIPAIHKTIVKDVWDLTDYPTAWPVPKG